MMVAKHHSVFSLTFWKLYWITMRPYLLFVSASAGMAGFAEGPGRGIGIVLIVFLVFFFSYGLGHGITDSFQIDTDSLSSPYRPLVQGTISRWQSLGVSITFLSISCAILFILNPWIPFLGFLCVLGLITYTPFKRKWWGGPFYNAWIVAILPIIGKLAASGEGTSPLEVVPTGIVSLIILSTFFSYANFVLMGYFKDISADKTSGYNTFVVAFGWNKAAVVSDFFALISIIATGWGILLVLGTETTLSWKWGSLLVFGASVTTLFVAQTGIHSIRDENLAYRPIAFVVRGFILLRLAEIIVLKPSWTIPSLLFYGAYEFMLKKRPEKRQV
jgi:4-hydroxybenzoate polyprenyltransferase